MISGLILSTLFDSDSECGGFSFADLVCLIIGSSEDNTRTKLSERLRDMCVAVVRAS